MFPCSSSTNEPHGSNSDAKSAGKFCGSYFLVMLPNESRSFFGYFMSAVFFSIMRFSEHCAFGTCIKTILIRCSKPKMRWVDAARIVSRWAIVTYIQSMWDEAEVEYPRCSVGQYNSTITSFSNLSVSIWHSIARPQPAAIGELDFGEEPSGKRWGQSLLSKIFCGNVALLHNSLPACATNAAGFFLLPV